MIDDRDAERRLEEWLHEDARPMPQYVLESSIEAVARTGQKSRYRPVALRWLDGRRLAAGAIAAVLVAAVTVGSGVFERFGWSQPSDNVGTSACVEPPSGITGWWPGDGGADDLVGNRDAELVGDATFAPGLISEAFALDGDGDFIDVPDNPALDVGRRDFSVALWVWFRDTDGEQVLGEKWVQRYNEPSLGWTMTKLEDNTIGFFIEDALGQGNGATSPRLDLRAMTWIHVAARRVGDTVDLYVNGQRVASEANPGILDLDSEASLKFGHRGGPVDTPGSADPRGYFLDGRVDEVQLLVGRAFSDEELRDAYRAGAAGYCRPEGMPGGS
jgi:hypothetical protein